jgi:hypothetical protein
MRSYYVVFGFLTEMCFDHLSVLCVTIMFGALRTFFSGDILNGLVCSCAVTWEA